MLKVQVQATSLYFIFIEQAALILIIIIIMISSEYTYARRNGVFFAITITINLLLVKIECGDKLKFYSTLKFYF